MQFFFEDHILDVNRRELRRGPDLVALEPQVFDLLVYLVQNRDRVVSKDDLIGSVWGGRLVSESTLTSRINAVRRAVGDSGEMQRLIRTIARKGIRFVGMATESTATGAAGQPEARPGAGPPSKPRCDNLPLRSSSFLGRDQDVATVQALLETTHLLTLIGSGGIGKTSLAIAAAAGVLERFKDGVWFVELAPLVDPKLVPSAVADVFDLREEPGRPLLSTLLGFLRDKQLLIVLDNCEHLVEACARLADAVLRVSGASRILATSREQLAITGELTWRVPALTTPNPKERVAAGDLIRYPATRLFVERATFARTSFQVTNDNAPAVAQICWQLDGIPLAIELAASRVKAMQVEQIVQRLSDRFLTGGNRIALPHQQTLRATIDWSYGLLSEPERVLMCRLSVFSGGWTLEAAEAVCADDEIQTSEVLDTLTRLVEKSLVVLDERGAEPRYRMLEMIRQYGHEKLSEARSVETLYERHLQYYVGVAESLEPHFYHPDQKHWYVKADVELDNIRGALEWSLTGRKTDDGMRLVSALHRYWVARVYWIEATTWFQRLFAAAEGENPTPLHAKARFVAGHITNYYDLVAAPRFGEESLRMARSLDYKQGIVNALWLMGWCHTPKLDGSALPYFEESIELARAIDYPWGAAHALAWCGVYKIGIGDYQAAVPLLQGGRIQADRLGGDNSLMGRCDGNLGLIALLQGDYAAARSYLDRSLALQIEAGNKNGTAESLWLQGRLALRQGDHVRAVGYFVQSLKLYQLYPHSLWVTRGLAYLTITYASCGQARLAAQIAGVLNNDGNGPQSTNAHLASLVAISEYEAALALTQTQTGTEFEAALRAGRTMSREQAIAFVSGHTHSDFQAPGVEVA